MKRYIGFLFILSIILGTIISSYAQGRGNGGGMQGGGGRMQQSGPPSSSMAVLSPDSVFVYAVAGDTLNQYSAVDLTLKRTVSLNSSSGRRTPIFGGSIFISKDGKKLYVMRGKTLYLFDALKLNIINTVAVESLTDGGRGNPQGEQGGYRRQ